MGLPAKHMFRTMDTDGDGQLSLKELEQGLETNGISVPCDLAEVFTACDSSREGALSFVDFVACLLPESLIDERLCHEAFGLLDPENKGRLNAKDLQTAFPCYELQRCEKMVRQADCVDKGYFEFEDF